MELENNKQYIVLNYSTSPVAVSTRFDSYTIPGAKDGEPTSYPLTLDEIMYINNNSGVFKYGLLWFEDIYAEAIYNKLRIRDYKKILTDDQIKDMLTDPTAESLNALISITNDAYFNRVRGIYLHIKNTTGLSSKVSEVIEKRYREIRDKKATSSMRVQDVQDSSNEVSELRRQVEALKKTIEGLTTSKGTANGVVESPATEKKPALRKSKASKPNAESAAG